MEWFETNWPIVNLIGCGILAIVIYVYWKRKKR